MNEIVMSDVGGGNIVSGWEIVMYFRSVYVEIGVDGGSLWLRGDGSIKMKESFPSSPLKFRVGGTVGPANSSSLFFLFFIIFPPRAAIFLRYKHESKESRREGAAHSYYTGRRAPCQPIELFTPPQILTKACVLSRWQDATWPISEEEAEEKQQETVESLWTVSFSGIKMMGGELRDPSFICCCLKLK